MKHIIKSTSLDGVKHTEIGKADYLSIIKAKESLLEALEIEEKLNIVLDNYKELEKFIAEITLENKLLQLKDWDNSMSKKQKLARVFSNYLSSTRLYLDHLMGHISRVYGKNSEEFKDVKLQTNIHYDESFSYRLLDALRNNMQHSSLPITFANVLKSSSSGEEVLSIVTPVLLVSDIGKKFKKTVLTEIEAIDLSDSKNRFDLKTHIREYLGRITEINQYVRDLMESDIKEWKCSILNIIKASEKLHSKKSKVHVYLIKENDSGSVVESNDIFNKFIELREYYVHKNLVLHNFGNRYITTIAERKVHI